MNDRRNRSQKPWYLERDPAQCLGEAGSKLILANPRRKKLEKFYDLYLGPQNHAGEVDSTAYNAIMSIVDTQCARLTKSLPDIVFHCVGADPSVAEKAKAMTRYIRGDWDRIDAGSRRRLQFRHAAIFGCGIIRVTTRHGQVEWEHPWVGNMAVPPGEERAWCIRTLYEYARVDRQYLKAQAPKSEHGKIDDLPASTVDSAFSISGHDEGYDDVVDVFFGWRLPDSPSRPGRHVIATGTGKNAVTIYDEEYTEVYFPHSFINYMPDGVRFFGRGIPERLHGLQIEQNNLAETLKLGGERLSGTHFILYGGSKIDNVETITNEVGTFVQITGPNPPLPMQVSPASEGFIRYKAEQKAAMFELEGVSAQSVASQKFASMSGRAALMQYDIESERHADKALEIQKGSIRLGELHRDALEILCESADEEGYEKPKVVAKSDGDSAALEHLEYDDVRLSRELTVCSVEVVNELASSPAAYEQYLSELVQVGTLTPADYLRLSGNPDIERMRDMKFAPRNLAEKLVAEAIRGRGDKTEATRACDLEHLITYGWQQHALSQLNGVTIDKLERLRQLIGHADFLLKQEAAEQAKAQLAMQQAATASASVGVPAMTMQPPGSTGPTPQEGMPIQ